MALFGNIGGTSEVQFLIKDCILKPLASALGQARQWDLPNFDGQVMVVDPAGDYLRWGNGAWVPDVLTHYTDGADLRVADYNSNAISGPILSGRLTLGGNSSVSGIIDQFRISSIGDDAFSTNCVVTFEHRIGGTLVPFLESNGPTGFSVPVAIRFGDFSGSAFGSLNGAPTASRSWTLPDKTGVISLDDEQAIVGLTIQTAPTGNVITVGEGAAYVPSSGKVINFAGGTITGNPTTNTTYHIYLTDLGTVVKSTTAPAAPYAGTARTSSSFTSQRYLGSVRSISGTAYIPQRSTADGNEPTVYFLWNSPASSSLLSGGTSTSAVDVSAASFAPTTSITLTFRLQNTGTANVRLYGWDGTAHVLWTNTIANTNYMTDVPCDTTPKIRYDVIAGGICGLVLYGYTYTR